MEKADIIRLAVQGTRWVKEHSKRLKGTDVYFQYSPESFSATEVRFALEVCEAVRKEWRPTPEKKMIFNLPSTVEVSTPNVYADMIEWFCNNISEPETSIVSVHTHNDRGTGVASTELGMMAGADRVEGTLFGNGERTGNVDIITVALNLFSQGVDPQLNFCKIENIRNTYERCTGMTVHERHPYSGELVFTAFSGSHQDAIRKGLAERNSGVVRWDVPYLLIDPKDIGREYEAVIRVNGQSGKAGIAHLLERDFELHLPKDLERDFGAIAGPKIDALGSEVSSEQIRAMFWKEYVDRNEPYRMARFRDVEISGSCDCQAELYLESESIRLSGNGNGPIDAFIRALQNKGIDVHVLGQSEHSLNSGEDSSAIAYISLKFSDSEIRWGVGVDTSIKLANIRAIISALNRK
jgi:2-isopropylmalate synthase